MLTEALAGEVQALIAIAEVMLVDMVFEDGSFHFARTAYKCVITVTTYRL
jgi:hypothetical protein